jgi:putative membrane protein insertion efficiency factor
MQAMMLRAIETYQRAFEGRPSPCRFFPSCSEYGHEAIRVHGAGRGLWLTTRRLARCRPFGPSGFDPVPLPDPPDVDPVTVDPVTVDPTATKEC